VKAEDIIRALAAEDIEEREFGKFGGPPTVCRRCCHILPGPHATICLWAAAKQWVEAADREPKLLFCGVRDGGDFWHLECRFDDGQKFAAIQVDKDHEKLADEIAAYLNTRNRDQRDSEGPGEAAEFTSAHSHCSMNQYEVCQGNQPPGTLCCVHCGHECGGFSGGGQ
jgi:hypothetical protein